MNVALAHPRSLGALSGSPRVPRGGQGAGLVAAIVAHGSGLYLPRAGSLEALHPPLSEPAQRVQVARQAGVPCAGHGPPPAGAQPMRVEIAMGLGCCPHPGEGLSGWALGETGSFRVRARGILDTRECWAGGQALLPG